jgi:tetratricopeptide (TPR) repeat protein
MNLSTSEPLPSAAPSAGSDQKRLAIFEIFGSAKSAVGIVTVAKNAEGKWGVSGSADKDENATKLRAVIDQFVADGNDHAGALAEKFRQAGYEVEVLPSGDYMLNLQFDLTSGEVIGTQEAMHPLATADNPLARNIVGAIAKGFRQPGIDLAEKIAGDLANRDQDAAVFVVREAWQSGIFTFPPSVELLDALMKIDVVALSSVDRRFIRELRMAIAHRLNRFDVAGAEGKAFLDEFEATLTRDQKTDLQMLFGLAAMVEGNRETALLIWREVLRETADLSAEQRAWAWRNISKALGIKDPEGLRACKHSADAFLEAGKKEEAGKSLMALANGQLFVEPNEAIKTIGEILALLDEKELRGRHLRAAALHTRAHRLMDLGRHQEALRDAREAVTLRRGLVGLENEFVSSLHLAALEAHRMRADDEAKTLEAEAEKVTNELDLPHFQLAKRLAVLGQAFDAQVAADLIRDAQAAHKRDIVAGVQMMQAMADPQLSDSGRLAILENTLKTLEHSRGRNAIEQPLRLAIATRLLKMNYPERAELQYRRLLEVDPLDVPARDGLIHCLWELEKWSDAAAFLQSQIKLRGEMPGLLFAYGKSRFEAGDINVALPALTKAVDLAGDNEALRKAAFDLREKALHLDATLEPVVEKRDSSEPVRREEIEAVLSAFATFIKQDKRMRFWKKIDEPPGHRWVDHPEGRAQDILHGWLKGAFGDRVRPFAEIDVGAGRVDLLVQFVGGLRIVIELKMCGYGYSSTYAAEGEEQILHYMDNSDTRLGYLVVLDARLDKNGQSLFDTTPGPNTVRCYLIDVRPRTSSKRKPGDEPESEDKDHD